MDRPRLTIIRESADTTSYVFDPLVVACRVTRTTDKPGAPYAEVERMVMRATARQLREAWDKAHG